MILISNGTMASSVHLPSKILLKLMMIYSPLNANELVVDEVIIRVYNKNPNLDILVRLYRDYHDL
jgi:hypothetical protein